MKNVRVVWNGFYWELGFWRGNLWHWTVWSCGLGPISIVKYQEEEA